MLFRSPESEVRLIVFGQKRLAAARISSADFTHLWGLWFSLCAAMNAVMSVSSSAVDRWTPRCNCLRVSSANHRSTRSEEHTSELQSLMRISYAVFCLKKKKHNYKHQIIYI